MANCGNSEHIRPIHACRIPRALLCLAALATLAGSGCTGILAPAAVVAGPANGMGQQFAYSDRVDRMVLGWRNKAMAYHAWNCRKHMFAGRHCVGHFGHGFCAGYRDVAAGGHGCVPPVPPRPYWSWRYQTAEGQAKVAAWFDGYPAGALAAAEDGAANWGQIQVSPLIEAQYAARGIGPPPGPGFPGAPGGPEGLPTDELPPGPMGLPPLAPEVKKTTPIPGRPRLTLDQPPAAPGSQPPALSLPAAQPTAFNAAGNPLRDTAMMNATAPLPERSFPNGLRSPFEQVSVPMGLPSAVPASHVTSSPVTSSPRPMPSVSPGSR